jgi:hypothetical protein
MEEQIGVVINEIYNIVNTQCKDPRTFIEDIIKGHTKEVLEKMSGKQLKLCQINTYQKEIRNIWETYKEERLYAYCCGSLILAPYWADDKKVINSILTNTCELLLNLSKSTDSAVC